jgi:hypothetical protein
MRLLRASAVTLAWLALAPLPGSGDAVAPAAAASASPRSQQSAVDERVLSTADGYLVRLEAGPPYAADEIAAEMVAMLDGLLHGPEMARLRITVVTPAEAAIACGSSSALACYALDRIILPGEQPVAGPPVGFLLAHEYAHHILAHRRNDPWPAALWGPKRWATALNVCTEVRRHELFLGYTTVPGEAFAESYAMIHFPELHLAWGYTDLLAGDEHSEAAARLDVVRPWTSPATRSYRGRLVAGRSVRSHLRFPLDGTAELTVTGTPRVAIELAAGRRPLARARPRGGTTRLSYTVCGQRRVALRLSSLRGSGPYVLKVTKP